jgi:hypothetical protein
MQALQTLEEEGVSLQSGSILRAVTVQTRENVVC